MKEPKVNRERKIIMEDIKLEEDVSVGVFITNLQRILQRYPGCRTSVGNSWSGYEDCELVCTVYRQETEPEYEARIMEEEAKHEAWRIRTSKTEEQYDKERKEEIARLEKKIKELKGE